MEKNSPRQKRQFNLENATSQQSSYRNLPVVVDDVEFELLEMVVVVDMLLEVTSSVHKPPLRRMRFTELTDGMVLGSHIF